jgi:hypothetical protein
LFCKCKFSVHSLAHTFVDQKFKKAWRDCCLYYWYDGLSLFLSWTLETKFSSSYNIIFVGRIQFLLGLGMSSSLRCFQLTDVAHIACDTAPSIFRKAMTCWTFVYIKTLPYSSAAKWRNLSCFKAHTWLS